MEGSINGFSTKKLVSCFSVASSVAVAAAVVLSRRASNSDNQVVVASLSSPTKQVWPDLELNWRTAVATLIGFLGSAFGTVGGVGGGGIFVPLLNLVVGFDTKSAAALSKCMIMGASVSSVWYNLRVAHPTKEVPILDYDLALLFQPMLLLGITFGVELSVVFPFWLITVLIIVLFTGTSSRSFFRGLIMWKQETIVLMEKQAQEDIKLNPDISQPLLVPMPKPVEKSPLEIFLFNLRWKGILVLLLCWASFLILQILKNNSVDCGPFFWIFNLLQIPVAVGVFIWKAVSMCKESRQRRLAGNLECVCEASIEWTPLQLVFCAFCGLLGGTVGGLLGSGGGFILGPLLLELGVIPQVASATATFVMSFSSSLSVVEFYFLKRFPIPYALFLFSVAMLAGFWGQCLVRKLVKLLKRASIIVFILSSVIFASALTMGVVGVEKSISMMRKHEYMGFESFCGN